ncbi:ion transporter [Magnetofaba australis]|uniref:BK channel n=1 Tax=Magnetofaba australis IT-1 TaxID=1434232 RepID=A0A1Y2K7E5_9PROT|nr:ion transporter [Magnetofaba australis]OSM06246.1 putative TrkA domain-containing protein [Magnetofaba australis IT-1]
MNDRPSLLRRIKALLHHLLEASDSRARQVFNLVMMIVVLASLTQMVLEVNPDLTEIERQFYQELEELFAIIFLIEYLLRWWVCSDLYDDFQHARNRYIRRHHRDAPVLITAHALRVALAAKWRWMKQPLSVVDLLAILPFFRVFRLLRVLRVLRVLKLFRYSKRLTFFSDVIAERAFELTSLLTIAGIIFGMVAVAFYVVEHGQNPDVTNLWEAVYWSLITITTVGYGDITPATSAGQVVAVTGTVLGMWVTVFMTSIVVTAVNERMFHLKEQRMERMAERLKNHYIVCGMGRVGHAVCETLKAEGCAFVAMDSKQELVDEAINRGWTALCGDVTEEENWARLGLAKARCVISTISEEASNIYLILAIRERRPDVFLIVTGVDDNSENRLLKLGADRAISPEHDGGQHMAYTALRPTAINLFDLALKRDHIELDMEEICVPATGDFVDVTVAEAEIGQQFGIIVVAIVRGQETFFPPANKKMLGGDTLVCLGHLDDLERLRRTIQSS